MLINNLYSNKITKNIIFSLFIFFLISIFYGPSLINFFHLITAFFSFYFFFYKNKFFKFNLNFTVSIISIFLLYLIFNSFFLVDDSSILFKSFFYFRFILTSYIISKFLEVIENRQILLSLCYLIISILLCFDIFYQANTGYDIFGFKAGICVYPGGEQFFDPKNCERFSGFFGEEYIAGSFLVTYGLFFLYFYYKFSNKNKINLFFTIISLIIILSGIFISGERNAFLGLILILFVNFIFNKSLRKYLFYLVILFSLVLTFNINKFDHIKYRYIEWPLNNISKNEGNIAKKFIQTQWGVHYITAYEIFLDNKLFGSGFKSFRKVCQDTNYSSDNLNQKYKIDLKGLSGCSTHPHNIYFELISEVGIIGLVFFILMIFSIIFIPLIKNLKKIQNYDEIIMVLSIIMTFLFPLRPTGSITSTVYATNLFFFIGFYLYLVNKHKDNE